MKIAIGSDHAGFECKSVLIEELRKKNWHVQDFGTYNADSTDYADFAHPVASAVESHENELGILICGSANGVAMTANKHQHIRAAICWNEELAVLARQHNNANILCLPARFILADEAARITFSFLEAEFEGGRHQRRIDKISC